MSKRSKVAIQLDMMSALDKPNSDLERFVGACIDNIKNTQYIQMRVTISELPKEQIKYITDNMAESNLTLCQLAYKHGVSTSKYRHKPLAEYVKLSVVPDELSYPEPDDIYTLEQYLSNCLNRITGLLIANKPLLSNDADQCNKVVKFLTRARNYVREQL